jgi:hypothetical protein
MTPRIIQDEGDVDTLGILWTCPIVRGPIKAAAHVLRARPGISSRPNPPTSATIAAKRVEWKAPGKTNTRLKPDWVSGPPFPAS